jgi:hypothetical protein
LVRVQDQRHPVRYFRLFETEEARQVHLNGEIPPALAQVATDLLAKDPNIRPVDLIAVK